MKSSNIYPRNKAKNESIESGHPDKDNQKPFKQHCLSGFFVSSNKISNIFFFVLLYSLILTSCTQEEKIIVTGRVATVDSVRTVQTNCPSQPNFYPTTSDHDELFFIKTDSPFASSLFYKGCGTTGTHHFKTKVKLSTGSDPLYIDVRFNDASGHELYLKQYGILTDSMYIETDINVPTNFDNVFLRLTSTNAYTTIKPSVRFSVYELELN